VAVVPAPQEQGNPNIDKPTQAFLMMLLMLTAYPMAPEINLTVFGIAIVYIGSLQSLDQYELKKESEARVSDSKGWLSRLLSSTRTVWMFPIISSLCLLSAYGLIKSSLNIYVEKIIMLFLGYTGTTQLALYIKALFIKAGMEKLDTPVPFL
jgi:hypothetical protein